MDGGYAVHFFPTLWALPFVLNCVLAERLAKPVLLSIRPQHAHSKFPAYYRWCRGPTRRQRERLESVGFQVERYDGYFGHSYYGAVGPLQAAENALAHALVRHPVPALTAYALVVLRKGDRLSAPASTRAGRSGSRRARHHGRLLVGRRDLPRT